MAGILGVGPDGRHVTPYDSWLDTRCAPYIAMMRDRAGAEVIRKTGGPPSFNHGPKILWWKHERPEVFAEIAAFVQPGSYAVMRLCGLDASRAFVDKSYLHFSGFADNRQGDVGRPVVRDVWHSAGQVAADCRFPRDRRPRHGRLGPPLRTQSRHTGRRRTGRHSGLVPGLRRDSRRRLRGRGRNCFRVRFHDRQVPGRHGARRAGLGPVGDSWLVASLRLHQWGRHEPGVVCPRTGQPGEEAGGRDAGAIEPPGRTARSRIGRSRFRAALGRPRLAEPAESARQLGRAELVPHRRPFVPGRVRGRGAGVLYLP